jgi:hypothetical protein
MENPPPQPSPIPPQPQLAQQPTYPPETMELVAKMHSGAAWFYWIAGLSIINSIIIVSGGNIKFVIGLGITEIIDGIAQNIGGAGKFIGLFMDLCVAGVFALFGIFARRGIPAAFIVGMIIYALDGMLYLLVQEWLSIGFHVFALYCIFSGFMAQRKLANIVQNLVPPAA